ncbi:MAG: DUF6443 domain-containing protein [Chloroflexi bacterium]|nr:DUF6443 domain-containing protein [Chloroflexota bacterium]
MRELRYDSPNNSFYFLTYYYYDGLGRLLQTRVEDDSGGYAQTVTSVDYDGLGNEIRRSVPATQQGLVGGYNSYQSPDWNTLEKTVTEYDALGRVITLTKPDGTIVSTGYFGSATVVTDALGRVKTAWSDFLGRLTGMIEPPTTGGSSTTTYEYDPENNLTRVTDAEGNITQIQYDNFALKSQMDDPDMGVWHYGYDALGRITRQDDARGTRLCFYYDAVGRIKGKLYQMNSIACPSDPGYAGYTQRYYYDEGGAAAYALGKRTSIANSDDTTAWTYDTRGRVVTETKSISGAPIPFVTAYTYNYNGSLNEVLYPDREHIFSSYNGARQPTAIQVKPVPLGAGLYQTYASGVTYTSLGQMTQLNMGSGLTTTYSYAPGTHLLQRIQVGNNLMDLQYNYDAVGNVVAITDTIGGDLSFSYDALDRLTGVSGTVSETYSYNAIGNFITKGGDIHWYSDTHKHAVTHVNGERVAWYDANGNMATRMENGTTYLQEWDAENRLTVVTDTLTGQSVRFAYDADGNRVKRMDAGGVVFYGSGIIELMVPATTTLNTSVNLPRPLNSFPWQSWPHGTRMRTYYYLGATRVAMRDTTALSTEVTFLHGDHLGSASLATSITGAKVGELRYMPFGEERTGFLGVPTDRTYTGQRRESFGLMDYGARYYSPRLGQFISADNIVLSPNDPQNLSRYSYVYNNPLRYIDPTGHNCRDPGTSEDECRTSGGGGAGVGGYWGGGTGKVSTSSSDSEAGVFERVVRFLCPACADGNNLSSPDQAKKVFDEVQRPEGSPWLLKVNERGLAVEKLLGGNLPRNFETIDRFKDGVATSIKSIDLLAPSYQNLNILKATVEGHINSVRLFKGASGRDVKITSDMITARVLSIGIPPGATQEQIKTLMELQQWAAPQGVDVIITIVK